MSVSLQQSDAMPHAVNSATLGDILERVLDKGIVVAGDIKVKLVEVELLTIQIRLVICSVDKAREMGIDWWRRDPNLSRLDATSQPAALPEAPIALPTGSTRPSAALSVSPAAVLATGLEPGALGTDAPSMSPATALSVDQASPNRAAVRPVGPPGAAAQPYTVPATALGVPPTALPPSALGTLDAQGGYPSGSLGVMPAPEEGAFQRSPSADPEQELDILHRRIAELDELAALRQRIVELEQQLSEAPPQTSGEPSETA